VVDSEIPSENAEENKEHSGDHEREPRECNKGGQSADITALIDAQSRQSEADREERRRQDRGNSFREWATIVLLFLAFSATVIQAIIFHGQLDEMQAANKIASDAVIASNRPWVGLSSVTGAKPVSGQPFKATVTLTNSGHEPATNMRGAVYMSIENNGEIEKKISPDCAFCSHSVVLPTNQFVIYPEFDASIMSGDRVEDIELGRKLILIRSSYRYTGAHGDAHTTNICVVYDAKTVTFPNCETGNDAD
jgi:hypothetical protein